MLKKTERMPVWKMIVYSLGQFGWSLLNAVAGLLIYFYMPPETGEAAFPLLVSRGVLLGMTVIGVSGFIGQFVGIFFDPWIGTVSDRSKSKLGRRRSFMLMASFPTAIFSFIIFTPPTGDASVINAVWVILTVLLFNLFVSAYRVPFTALIPELGHSSEDRMLLCTFNSVTWALGFFVGGSAIYGLKTMLQSSGISPVAAFRIVVAGFAVLGFLLMTLPLIVIDEKRYCSGQSSPESPLRSIIEAFKNKDFVVFTLCQTTYTMADLMLQLGLVYFITILMRLNESWVFTLGASAFGMSFLWYLFVNIIAAKGISKKKMTVFAYILQAAVYVMIFFAGRIPHMPNMVWAWIIIVMMSVVAAVTGIVPGAITADIIRADAIRTGVHKEASFYGATSVFMKIPLALPPLIVPSLLLLGRSVANSTGVRLIALVAFVLTFISTAVLFIYNEKRTIETLSEEKDHNA